MIEEQVIAYVDGEMGPIEALRFERSIAADPALAAEVERHRNLRETIAGHFSLAAHEPIPDRLTAILDRPHGVIHFPRKSRGAWNIGPGGRYAALAATLVAGLLAGQMSPRSPSGLIGTQGGAIVATGELAHALDSRLASASQLKSARIGVSFKTADNHYCRTFSLASGAGIGCRNSDRWTIERFAAGADSGSEGRYRQAASPSAEIMAAAQEMMAGVPLDAAGEREARDRHWTSQH